MSAESYVVQQKSFESATNPYGMFDNTTNIRGVNPPNSSTCNFPHENNGNSPINCLTNIDEIGVNPSGTSNVIPNREETNPYYSIVDSRDYRSEINNSSLTKVTHENIINTGGLATSNSTSNFNWDKERSNVVSDSSVGFVSNDSTFTSCEQSIDLKEEMKDETQVESKTSEFSTEILPHEPQILCNISKESYDTGDSSSDESSSGIIPYDVVGDQEKYALIKCEECGMYLKSKGNLKVHMRIHTCVYPYTCNDCGESFPSCNLYHEHMLEHEPGSFKAFSCSYCDKTFNCKKHFNAHNKKHLASKMYNCFACNQSFATKDRLQRHSKVHSGETSLFCEKCGKFFSSKFNYDQHKQIHVKRSWKCEDCEEEIIFNSAKDLETHILSTHDDPSTADEIMQPVRLAVGEGNKKFGCEICSIKFEKLSDYYIHRCSHKAERTFKCSTCSVSFFREYHLTVHSATHEIDGFICSVCGSSFKSKNTLKFHMREHNEKLPFECIHCDFSFNDEDSLNSHMSTHLGDKPFSCDECHATFRHCSTLEIHKRIHSGDTPFLCSVCGASFIHKNHLQIHLRSHSNNKPYKCNECNVSFTKKDYLFAHRTKHRKDPDIVAAEIVSGANFELGVSNFRCTYCEMTFSHQSTLSTHLRKHTGERPFVCDKCGASFLYSSNLTTHRRKHTGERPYRCKECDASFTLKSYLTMHLRKHSGERPFKCDFCDSSFTQKTHLSTHRRIHTGEYPYKCDVCGEAFRDGANFWRHKKRHHGQTSSGEGGSAERSLPPRKKKIRIQVVESNEDISAMEDNIDQ